MCFRGARVSSVRVTLVLIFIREREYLCVSSKLNVKVNSFIFYLFFVPGRQNSVLKCDLKGGGALYGNEGMLYASRVPSPPLTIFSTDGEKVIPHTLPTGPAFNPMFLKFFILQIPKNC